jgi:hypothetical protein
LDYKERFVRAQLRHLVPLARSCYTAALCNIVRTAAEPQARSTHAPGHLSHAAFRPGVYCVRGRVARHCLASSWITYSAQRCAARKHEVGCTIDRPHVLCTTAVLVRACAMRAPSAIPMLHFAEWPTDASSPGLCRSHRLDAALLPFSRAGDVGLLVAQADPNVARPLLQRGKGRTRLAQYHHIVT